MKGNNSKTPATSIALSLVLLSGVWTGAWLNTSARAEQSSGAAQEANKNEVLNSISELVKEFFPKAKIVVEGQKLHFEYKVHNYQNQYSNRQEPAPDNGGILGDLEIKSGPYTGKEKLPKEQSQYFYTSLNMAPLLKGDKTHLAVRLGYPPDTPMEFLDRFKDAINQATSSTVAAAPEPPPPAATPSQPAAGTASSGGETKPVPVAAAPAAPAQPVAPAQPTKRKLFFWKATRGKEVVYLLGTIHVAPASLYPLPAEIDDAFDQSKELIVEVAIDRRNIDSDMVQKLVKTAGTYTAPDKLSKHMSAGTRKVFEDYLKWAGESWEMYDQYKPWFVTEMVQASAPRRGDILKIKGGLGLDRYFLARSKDMNKTVGEFETVDFQIGLHSRLSEEVQDRLLQTSLLQFKDSLKDLNELFDTWRAGDPDKMDEIINRVVREHPDLLPYNKALLDQRNVGMATKLDQMSKTLPGPLFVAVGSAHMLGETGLVSAMTKKGFDVEQVYTTIEPVTRPADAPDLKVFGSERFKAWFPATPKKKQSGVVQYELEDGDKGIYAITFMQLDSDQSKWAVPGGVMLDKLMSAVILNMRATSIARHTVMSQGALCRQLSCLVSDAPPGLKTIPAHDGQPAKKPDLPSDLFISQKPPGWFNNKAMKARAFLIENRVYVVLACGTKQWVDSADVDKFMNSLQIIR